MLNDIVQTVRNAVKELVETVEHPVESTIPAPPAERDRRLNICNKCIVRTGGRCDTQKTHPLTGKPGCGCFISAKSSFLNKHCPSDMW